METAISELNKIRDALSEWERLFQCKLDEDADGDLEEAALALLHLSRELERLKAEREET